MIKSSSCFVVLAGLTLVGCSSVKNSLGMSASNVDAYMIEPHDLTLPPDYKIHPPKSGESNNSTTTPSTEKSVEDVLKKS